MKRLVVVLLLVLVAASAWSVDVWVKGWFSDAYIQEELSGPIFKRIAQNPLLNEAGSEESADILVIISGIENRNFGGELTGFSFGVTFLPPSMPMATGNAVYICEPTEYGIGIVGGWIIDYLMGIIANSIGFEQGVSL